MDAMDITSLPTPPPERESKVVKEEYIDGAVDSVSNENVEFSFEDLICAMFDEVMQEKDEVSSELLKNSSLENEVLLNGEISVDEDVDSLIEIQGKVSGDVKNQKSFLPLLDEDFVAQEEEIPVIECELELSSSSIKDKKLTKNTKEESLKEIEKKDEEKEETVGILPKEEHKNVFIPTKEKVENSQKLEIKKEEDSVENAVDVVAHKAKKQVKKLNISVEDLRTAPEVQNGDTTVAMEDGNTTSFDGEAFTDGRDVASPSASASSQKAENVEGASSNQFSSILAEQIKANSAELVQRGKIVLRDGNVGEIRLQLKPAHLGVVRINLKMTGDKKMQGEVTVSSQEAYNAFEDSMEDLISSFKDAGFDTSGFDLNWKGGKEEIVMDDLRNKYFSPEKTVLSLREKLNVTENIYKFGQAENVNILA